MFLGDSSSVTSREGRVSRNTYGCILSDNIRVTSREGRVSRNMKVISPPLLIFSHVPRGACE